jgi:hypothetical protein
VGGRLVLTVMLLTLLAAPAASASASSRPDLTPYAGVGTWLDIYAKRAWRHPEAEVAAMARDGPNL